MTSKLNITIFSGLFFLILSLPLRALGQEEGSIARILGSIGTPDDNSGVMAVLNSMSGENMTADVAAVLHTVASRSEEDHTQGMTRNGVLDFISSAYPGNNYYTNGFYGNRQNGSSQSLYNGPMPQYNPDDFYRPVWGRITSRFGFRESFGRMHKGVDLALNIGDTVRAALPGIVNRVGYEAGGYGNYVVITHSNGAETRYAHLQGAIVVAGQKVDSGEAIALGGNTGNSTGPHLHFEIRHMGTPVDPLTVFDFSGRSMNMARRNGIQLEPHQLVTGFSAQKTTLKEKSTYVVREGDTVKSIAKRAGLTPLRLCQLNFITESTPLQPGTMLKLR